MFNFLADAATLIDLPQDKQIIITKEDRCLFNPNCNSRDIDFCSQEEADTRIFLHAVKHGFYEIQIKTGDTDVLVLGISFFKKINVQKLWIAFGTNKKYKLYAVHDVKNLGEECSLALLMFHSFTGCDTVSGFFNIGKATAWKTWKIYNEVTPVFIDLANCPNTVSAENLQILERFVILMYNKTSDDESVNSCRKHLFTMKGKIHSSY